MAIYRGTLPPDNYTPVLNAWLRDPATTYKAKGILCAIASHKADYALTVAQLVAQSRDGEAAVYTALRELVKVGYLRMERKRKDDGTLAESDFYLVPEPAGMHERVDATLAAHLATRPRKSRSGDDQPTRPRKSTSGKSTRGESGSKKTRNQKTRLEEDQPPLPVPDPPAAPPAPADVQEEEGTDGKGEARTVLAVVLERAGVPDRRPTGGRADRLAAIVADHLAAGWPPAQLTAALGESMVGVGSVYGVLLTRLRELGPPPRVPKQTARPELPEWCRYCDKSTRMAVDDRDRLVPCPRCHPDHAVAAAAR